MSVYDTHEEIPPARPSADDVLRLQREANETLVLHALRAQEEIDDAHTAQRNAESESEELRASEDELRATAEFRERIIGIIGHDLRTPLNTLIMAGGLLIGHGNLCEDDARLAVRIVSSGQRMARMISQLVDFARARLGGDFEFKLGPTDFGAVCQDIAEELRIGTSADIVVTTEGSLLGTWDADRLAQAVANIAGNAVDYATTGTPVLIHACAAHDSVVAEITNHGVTIPPDVLPGIFKAFRRGGRAATEKPGHLGLGLYIACEIVRAHGGTLKVRSADGITTFTLKLPRVVPDGVRRMEPDSDS